MTRKTLIVGTIIAAIITVIFCSAANSFKKEINGANQVRVNNVNASIAFATNPNGQ